SSAVSAAAFTGMIRPSIFSDGGAPVVMKRSDAFCLSISCSKSVMFIASLLAVDMSRRAAAPCRGRTSPPSELRLVERQRLGRLGTDQAPLDQVQQALVHGLHVGALPGLHDRVHLRNLVLANQVADRRHPDH